MSNDTMNNPYLQKQIIKRLLYISTQSSNPNWVTWSTHKDVKQTLSDEDMVTSSYHMNGKFDPQYAVNVCDYTLVIRNVKFNKSYSINIEEMIDGLNILYKRYPAFRDRLDNNDLDDETSNAFLQCAAFGQIAYA